jgi:hypothetical protein
VLLDKAHERDLALALDPEAELSILLARPVQVVILNAARRI